MHQSREFRIIGRVRLVVGVGDWLSWFNFWGWLESMFIDLTDVRGRYDKLDAMSIVSKSSSEVKSPLDVIDVFSLIEDVGVWLIFDFYFLAEEEGSGLIICFFSFYGLKKFWSAPGHGTFFFFFRCFLRVWICTGSVSGLY